MQTGFPHYSTPFDTKRRNTLVGIVALIVLSCINILLFLLTFGMLDVQDPDISNLYSAHQKLGLGGISLAISTQIGSGLVRAGGVGDSQSVSQSVLIGQIETGRGGYLSDHFESLDAYARILNRDLSVLLNTSENRTKTLDTYIDELVFRRADAVEKITNLQTTSDLFSDEITSISQRITEQQQSIETSYNSRDEDSIYSSLDRIEQLRAQEIQLRGQRAILDKLITDFRSMQQLSAEILTVVVPNKDMIASGQTISIGDSGTGLLEQLGSILFQTSQ